MRQNISEVGYIIESPEIASEPKIQDPKIIIGQKICHWLGTRAQTEVRRRTAVARARNPVVRARTRL